MKYVVFLGDGMADTPVPELGGKTPLEAAVKPNIDRLAREGIVGMVKTVPDGMSPGSDTANLSAMGYDPEKYYTGRSPLEAVSVGVPLDDGDITFRVNLVTLSDEEEYEEKTMIDYSSDEITTEESHILIKDIAAALDNDVNKFYPGFSYRHILVWKNGRLTFKLTPPHNISGRKIAEYMPEGENSEILTAFMKKSVEILKDHPVNKRRIERGLRPATSIWIWGEGSKAVLPEFESLRGVSGGVISAVDLLKGIGISAKMECPDIEGATGNIHTNFDGKARAATELLERNDFVYIHIEAPDECGHRGETENKVKSIELIDSKIVGPVLEYLDGVGEEYRILIMPDHPTPLDIKTHTGNPVPYVIYDSRVKKSSGVEAYTEAECSRCGNYNDKGCTLMDILING